MGSIWRLFWATVAIFVPIEVARRSLSLIENSILAGILETVLVSILGVLTVIVVSLAYFVFVAYRTTRREQAPPDETEPHQQLSAQIPLTPELAHLPEEVSEKTQ